MHSTTKQNLTLAVALLCAGLIVAFVPAPTSTFVMFCAFIVAAIFTSFLYAMKTDEPEVADPWEMQRTLMRASDQLLPGTPLLTKHALMYLALNLEEMSETIYAACIPLEGYYTENSKFYDFMNSADAHSLAFVHSALVVQAQGMRMASRTIRDALASIGDGSLAIPLTASEAVELLDGVTDVAVVNCGLALSLGMPGQAAYEEVARSNLSKRNPATGKIDKTPDGKWIKGRGYTAPDLYAVLATEGILPRA